ncbi:type VI secretion system-associated protein TagF [Burkholderia guangdongensis]|uniref:type VI secretion system-associated protein TagF n=1 Tax=Burkholderia guangdongensis TaxID=1792500 RepID=UPI0015CAC882|nr:type VI secretion system-associated protein TagF [Burkholderia guangdongensis]
MSDANGQGPGFFGKVRTHGDFVSRRLPGEFTAPWDLWLQRGMLAAREWFAAQWLPVYLNAPLWHFALGAGVCGASAWAGVLMPGVDRVGRYFPFTIAAPVRGVDSGDLGESGGWLRGSQRWYDDAARFALSTLADDFVLERFDDALNAMPLPGVAPDGGVRWRLALADGGAGRDAFAERLASSVSPGRCAWWTEGSDAVPPTLRVAAGLPDARQFAALLDAACPGWETVAALTRLSGDAPAG